MNENERKAYNVFKNMGAFEPSAIERRKAYLKNVFERRKAMKNLASGNFTQDNINDLSYNPQETYGELEQLSKQDTEGRKIEASYRGENRSYWLPNEKVWASGKGIRIDQAYLILGEDDKTMKVKEVKNFSELESITKALYGEIRRILKK